MFTKLSVDFRDGDERGADKNSNILPQAAWPRQAEMI